MRYTWVLLTIIIFLASFLRLWHLDINPPGLYLDEQSIGYNAYSILKTGRDEHGTFLPLEFKALGEYKLPVYVYLTTFSIVFLGPTDFAVRFPSALSGILTVLISFFLIAKLFPKENNAVPLLTAFFLAITPWHIHFSRGGFEATTALFFITSGFWLILNQERKIQLIGLISLILAFYTYNASRIFVPIMLVVWNILFLKRRNFSKQNLVFYGLLFTVSLLPFFISLFSGAALIRSSQTAAFEESMRRFPTFNVYLSHGFTFIANISSYFSPAFLFFSSDGNGRHSVIEMGNLYIFQLPLVLTGFVWLIRQKKQSGILFSLFWLITAAFSAAFFRPSPHALRSLFMVIPLSFMSVVGLVKGYGYVARFSFLKRLSIPIVCGILIYSISLYLHIYYVHYQKIHTLDWGGGYRKLFTYLSEVENQYNQITVTNWWGQAYIAGLWYLKFDPQKYHSRDQTKTAFGKYSFGEHLPPDTTGRALLVYPSDLDPGGKKINSIYLLNNDEAFVIWEFE